jgi:hypothetical protein
MFGNNKGRIKEKEKKTLLSPRKRNEFYTLIE